MAACRCCGRGRPPSAQHGGRPRGAPHQGRRLADHRRRPRGGGAHHRAAVPPLARRAGGRRGDGERRRAGRRLLSRRPPRRHARFSARHRRVHGQHRPGRREPSRGGRGRSAGAGTHLGRRRDRDGGRLAGRGRRDRLALDPGSSGSPGRTRRAGEPPPRRRCDRGLPLDPLDPHAPDRVLGVEVLPHRVGRGGRLRPLRPDYGMGHRGWRPHPVVRRRMRRSPRAARP